MYGQRLRTPSFPARDPHATRTVAREHARMGVFVGTWHIEGRNAPQPGHHEWTAVAGDESFDYLPGNFFLLCKLNRRTAEGTHNATSILGYDPERRAYFAHNYDNLGYAREYTVIVDDRVWRFIGRYERGAITLAPDERSFSERWELSKDGVMWTPLCDLHATKLI